MVLVDHFPDPQGLGGRADIIFLLLAQVSTIGLEKREKGPIVLITTRALAVNRLRLAALC